MCSQVDAVLPRSPLSLALERAVRKLAGRAELSRRECGVLRLMAMGYAYPEIAEQLGITARTVKMHAGRLRTKLGVESRQAVIGLLFAV